jgi:hypothetical protein
MNLLHYEQTHANSCVAACMCMIQLFRGQAPTEQAFHQGVGPRGQSPQAIFTLGGVTSIRCGLGEDHRTLIATALLSREVLVVIQVLSHPYVRWLAGAYPTLRTRHGILNVPGDYDGLPHAVVLAGRADDGFGLLDPYFLPDEQALYLPDDDFESFFGGLALAATR